MRIEVLIDELVLHGFDPHERHAVGDGLSAELTRLLAADAASWTSPRRHEIARVAGHEVTIAPGQAAGPALAGAVRSAITTATRGRP
jgi:hypothetical protein